VKGEKVKVEIIDLHKIGKKLTISKKGKRDE